MSLVTNLSVLKTDKGTLKSGSMCFIKGGCPYFITTDCDIDIDGVVLRGPMLVLTDEVPFSFGYVQAHPPRNIARKFIRLGFVTNVNKVSANELSIVFDGNHGKPVRIIRTVMDKDNHIACILDYAKRFINTWRHVRKYSYSSVQFTPSPIQQLLVGEENGQSFQAKEEAKYQALTIEPVVQKAITKQNHELKAEIDELRKQNHELKAEIEELKTKNLELTSTTESNGKKRRKKEDPNRGTSTKEARNKQPCAAAVVTVGREESYSGGATDKTTQRTTRASALRRRREKYL